MVFEGKPDELRRALYTIGARPYESADGEELWGFPDRNRGEREADSRLSRFKYWRPAVFVALLAALIAAISSIERNIDDADSLTGIEEPSAPLELLSTASSKQLEDFNRLCAGEFALAKVDDVNINLSCTNGTCSIGYLWRKWNLQYASCSQDGYCPPDRRTKKKSEKYSLYEFKVSDIRNITLREPLHEEQVYDPSYQLLKPSGSPVDMYCKVGRCFHDLESDEKRSSLRIFFAGRDCGEQFVNVLK